MSDHAIAVGAKQAANSASLMVVVNVERSILRAKANGAFAALLRKHLGVHCLRHSIFAYQVTLSNGCLFFAVPPFLKVRVFLPPLASLV
jgi:hypothetical protein